MMTAKEVENDVSDLVSSLLQEGIAVDSNPVLLSRRGYHTHVAWPSALETPPVDHEDFASVGEYRQLLRTRHYTCLLVDGSFIQLGYTFRRDELVRHRLCFYPSPVLLSPQDMDSEFDVRDLIDLYLAEELAAFERMGHAEEGEWTQPAKLRMRSPMRFDYDLDAQAEGHPACHLHITNEGCRWATYGPLSVGHFSRFIFRHFFPVLFSQYEFLRVATVRRDRRSITVPEEGELFIDWRSPAV